MRTRRFFSRTRLLGLLLGLAALVGCGRDKVPATAGPPMKLVIGNVKGENRAILYMAEHLGSFQRQGLDVDLRTYAAGIDAMADLRAGHLDISSSSDFVFASNLDQEPDLRILASIARANSTYVVGRKDRGIQVPGDLKGKRIGLVKGSVADYFLGKYLYSLHLTWKDVKPVWLAGKDQESQFAAGGLDAAISWDPISRRMKAALGANGVAWPAQLNNPWHVVLVAKTPFIQGHREALVRFLRALMEAETYIQAHPEETRAFMAAHLGMTEAYLAEVWEDNRFLVALDRSLLLTLEEESRWTIQQMPGRKQKLPNFLDYIHLDAMDRANPEAVTIIH